MQEGWIALGVVLALVVVGGIVFFFICRKRRARKYNDSSSDSEPVNVVLPLPAPSPSSIEDDDMDLTQREGVTVGSRFEVLDETRKSHSYAPKSESTSKGSTKSSQRESCILFEAPPPYEATPKNGSSRNTRMVPMPIPSENSLITSENSARYMASAGNTPRRRNTKLKRTKSEESLAPLPLLHLQTPPISGTPRTAIEPSTPQMVTAIENGNGIRLSNSSENSTDAFSTGEQRTMPNASSMIRSETNVSLNGDEAGRTPRVHSPPTGDASKMTSFTPTSDNTTK